MKCQHCEEPFSAQLSRRAGVEYYWSFCSQFCENTALSHTRSFEISEPCFSQHKYNTEMLIGDWYLQQARAYGFELR